MLGLFFSALRSLRVSRGLRSRLHGAVTELNSFPQWTDDGAIEAVVRQFLRLASINLRDCLNMTDAGLVALFKGFPGLTNIDLGECVNATDEVPVETPSQRDPAAAHEERGVAIFAGSVSMEFGE